MQRMAKPGTKAYPQAQALSASRGLRAMLAADLLLHVLALGAAVRQIGTGAVVPAFWPWLAVGYALLAMVASLGALGLRPRAISWRRRLGLLAVAGVLWRGGAYAGSRELTLGVVVWTGAIWVATLLEGRRIAAAIVAATGEEGLGDDPSRHL